MLSTFAMLETDIVFTRGGESGKYQHEVETQCWYLPLLLDSSQGTDIIQVLHVCIPLVSITLYDLSAIKKFDGFLEKIFVGSLCWRLVWVTELLQIQEPILLKY